MKAITLDQPWATLIADGWKILETRSWQTDYRGPLAIHAAKKPIEPGVNAIRKAIIELDPETYGADKLRARMAVLTYPKGVIVATCQLVSCDLITEPLSGSLEAAVGDHTPGRYAWRLAAIQALRTPIECAGHQRLWDTATDLDAQLAAG